MTERDPKKEKLWKQLRCEKYPYQNTTLRCIQEAKYILKCYVDDEAPGGGNLVNYQVSVACGNCMRHILRNSDLVYEAGIIDWIEEESES